MTINVGTPQRTFNPTAPKANPKDTAAIDKAIADAVAKEAQAAKVDTAADKAAAAAHAKADASAAKASETANTTAAANTAAALARVVRTNSLNALNAAHAVKTEQHCGSGYGWPMILSKDAKNLNTLDDIKEKAKGKWSKAKAQLADAKGNLASALYHLKANEDQKKPNPEAVDYCKKDVANWKKILTKAESNYNKAKSEYTSAKANYAPAFNKAKADYKSHIDSFPILQAKEQKDLKTYQAAVAKATDAVNAAKAAAATAKADAAAAAKADALAATTQKALDAADADLQAKGLPSAAVPADAKSILNKLPEEFKKVEDEYTKKTGKQITSSTPQSLKEAADLKNRLQNYDYIPSKEDAKAQKELAKAIDNATKDGSKLSASDVYKMALEGTNGDRYQAALNASETIRSIGRSNYSVTTTDIAVGVNNSAQGIAWINARLKPIGNAGDSTGEYYHMFGTMAAGLANPTLAKGAVAAQTVAADLDYSKKAGDSVLTQIKETLLGGAYSASVKSQANQAGLNIAETLSA